MSLYFEIDDVKEIYHALNESQKISNSMGATRETFDLITAAKRKCLDVFTSQMATIEEEGSCWDLFNKINILIKDSIDAYVGNETVKCYNAIDEIYNCAVTLKEKFACEEK